MSDNKNYTPAVLPPGVHKVKVNSIDLRNRPYKTKEGDIITDVILNVESAPLPNFKGLKKDYNDPNCTETYLGQVGRLKISEWGFKGVNMPDFQISKSEEILRALKSLFIETGQLEWFKAQDAKHATPEELVSDFNYQNPIKGFYFFICAATRQYTNKKGYATDDLYLPKWTKEGGSPFSTKLENLIKYDAAVHFAGPRAKTVTSFEPVTATEPQKEAIKEVLKTETSLPRNPIGESETSRMEREWTEQAAKHKEPAKVDPAYEDFMKGAKTEPIKVDLDKGAKSQPTYKGNDIKEEGGIVINNDRLPWEE